MKYLLIITLLCYGFSAWAYKSASRPGDDFGAGAMFLLLLAISFFLTVLYFSLALWHQRFL